MNKVKMSCCPNHCRKCQSEVNAEQKATFREAASIHLCHTGPMPTPDIAIDDVPDLVLDNDDDDDDDEPSTGDDALEEGDRVFIATIPCEAEFI